MPAGCGEVVINTAMVGYPELLTDSSYNGQIVIMTYPHIGNYGVAGEWSEADFPRPWSAFKQVTGDGDDASHARLDSQLQGLIMRACHAGAHDPARENLHRYLEINALPSLTDIDTRALTLLIRSRGALYGAIVSPPAGFHRWDAVANIDAQWRKQVMRMLRAARANDRKNKVIEIDARRQYSASPESSNAASSAPTPASTATASSSGRQTGKREGAHSDTTIVLIDCGYKRNIIRELMRLKARIEVCAHTDSSKDILARNPSLVVISNGPGDPEPLHAETALVASLIGQVPLFGICLGHQLIAQALGAQTYKMEFGHHGINHPVLSVEDRRVYVTSQNHEFAVRRDSLPQSAQVWFENVNDNSIEGIRDERRHIYAVQFHPEAAPGPHDCAWLFAHVYALATQNA